MGALYGLNYNYKKNKHNQCNAIYNLTFLSHFVYKLFKAFLWNVSFLMFSSFKYIISGNFFLFWLCIILYFCCNILKFITLFFLYFNIYQEHYFMSFIWLIIVWCQGYIWQVISFIVVIFTILSLFKITFTLFPMWIFSPIQWWGGRKNIWQNVCILFVC